MLGQVVRARIAPLVTLARTLLPLWEKRANLQTKTVSEMRGLEWRDVDLSGRVLR